MKEPLKELEMSGYVELEAAQWSTSTYSTNGGQCVEVAGNLPGVVAVRDSKDPAGGAHVVRPGVFRVFLRAVRDGRF